MFLTPFLVSEKERRSPMTTESSESQAASFGDRIRKVRGSIPPGEFAAVFDIHKNTLARYERGESLPDAGFLSRLCDKYGINPSWVLMGTGPQKAAELPPYSPNGRVGINLDVYVYIPLYNVVASGGGGAFPGSEEVVDALAFKRDWIRSELRANPRDLVLVMMTGESMQPTLGKDDVLLVNRRVGQARSDGIYLVRAGEALLVKRLQFLPDGAVCAISDNSAYAPFTVRPDPDSTDFRIIGRVVWVGKKL